MDAPRPRLQEVPVADAAKRALQSAATVGHSPTLVGPRDACSMLAVSLPGLLSDLDARAALKTSMVHSMAGLLACGRLVRRPPFRVVDADASEAVLFRGGRHACPGEVDLAHGGVSLLDGLERFPPSTLEGLRLVMASGASGLAHRGVGMIYPARFRLLGLADP